MDALLVGVALGISGAAFDVLEVDDLVVNRLFRLVQQLDEGADPPLVREVVLLVGALVLDRDVNAGVQERELAQALGERVEVELRDREDLGVRPRAERYSGSAGRPAGSA